MKQNCSLFFPGLIISLFLVPGNVKAQVPPGPEGQMFRQEGIASWYGAEFDGRPTASGEIFNSALFTAAHPTLPFGTVLTITNTHNNKRVSVRVNDRGPFVSARIIDVSRAAAEHLDMLATGTAPVVIESTGVVVFPQGTGPNSGPEESPAPGGGPGLIDQGWASGAPPDQPPPALPASPAPAEAALPAPAPAAAIPPALPAARQSPLAIAAVPAPAAVLKPPAAPLAHKVYRLQVGSYRVPRNAVEAFERLKNAGLNPAYERHGEFFRVVLAWIRGDEVYSVTEKLGSAGFREALIREEP
jgi:rare lipoprotein A